MLRFSWKYVLWASWGGLLLVFLQVTPPLAASGVRLFSEIWDGEGSAPTGAELAAEITGLRADSLQLVVQLEEIMAQVPARAELSALYNILGSTAARHEVALVRLTPHPVKEETISPEIVIDAEYTAAFPAMLRFLYEIERVNRLLRVTRLTMEPQGKSPVRIRGKVSFNAYLR